MQIEFNVRPVLVRSGEMRIEVPFAPLPALRDPEVAERSGRFDTVLPTLTSAVHTHVVDIHYDERFQPIIKL